MYIFEALFVTGVDIILPTSDTISDFIMVLQVIQTTNANDEFIPSPVWAIILMLPIIANIAFTL